MKQLIYLALVSFVMHGVWERAHVGLYIAPDYHPLGLPLLLWATLGDVAVTFLVWLLFGAIKKDWNWVQKMDWRDASVLVFVGFAIACDIEYRALFRHAWAYKTAMPLIFGIGLSPVAQMTILLPLSFYCTKYLLGGQRNVINKIG